MVCVWPREEMLSQESPGHLGRSVLHSYGIAVAIAGP